MDVKLAVLADFASLTREGKLNILGIFDQVNPAQLPAVVPHAYVVVVYEAGPAEVGLTKELSIVMTDSDGTIMTRIDQSVAVSPPAYAGSRTTIHQINGLMQLTFPSAGLYQLTILINGQEEGSIPLRVAAPPEQVLDAES